MLRTPAALSACLVAAIAVFGTAVLIQTQGSQEGLEPAVIAVNPLAADHRAGGMVGPGTRPAGELADGPKWSDAVEDASSRPFRAVKPEPVFDTRVDGDFPGGLPAGYTGTLKVSGANDIPLEWLAAVVVNVTAVDAKDPGFLRLYKPGSVRMPESSSLNYEPGRATSNLAIVEVNDRGEIAIHNQSQTHLIFDVEGYIQSGNGFTAIFPERGLDTRESVAFSRGETKRLPMAGKYGVPAQGADSVVVNLTATEHRQPGYLTAWPHAGQRPNTSNMNFKAGQTRASMAIVPLGPDGSIDLYSHSDGHAIVDVVGYFETNRGYTGITPFRAGDTRNGNGPLPANSEVRIPVAGIGEMPAGGIDTALINVTVTNSASPGFISVANGSLEPSTTSNVSYAAGDTIANTVFARILDDGTVRLRTTARTDVIVDVYGYVASAP